MSFKITFDVPERYLGKTDVIFNVRRGKVSWGKLKVARTGVLWLSSTSAKGWKMSWRKFGEVMQENGRLKR